MGKKLFVAALLLCLCLTALIAGGQQDVAGQMEFRININQEPQILDPIHFRDDKATSIIYALQEPLLRISTTPKGWEPGLAESYTANDDRTVFTFKLRSNAKWEDGTAITADDVVYNFQQAIDPAVASEKAFDYFDILNAEEIANGNKAISALGVKALNSNTVQFTLKRPVDYFIDLIKMPGFAPVQKAARETFKELYGTDAGKVVSSGPYKLESWEHDAEIVLVKNENYWDAANVSCDRLIISMAKDTGTVTSMYFTEALDFIEVSPDYLSQFRGEDDFYTLPLGRVNFIEFNPNKAFLDNIKIREALSIAFNRTEYVEKVLGTGELPAYGLIPPGIRGKSNGDFRKQVGNLVSDVASEPGAGDRAVKLLNEGLAEMGKTKEDLEASLEVYCVDSPKARKVAQAIQQMWFNTLDINLMVVPMQVKMLIPLLMSGEFQMVIGGGRTGTTPDPAYFIDFIYYENKWDDPVYTEMLENSLVATGDERMDYLMQAEKYVLDKFVFIPQQFGVLNYALKTNVKGFRAFPITVQYDFKYISVK